MTAREHRAYRLVFLFILAPIGAVVLMTALLLFGVSPHAVFLPGNALKSALGAAGVHPPNAVGVIATGVGWWVVVAGVGVGWERWRRRRQRL